MSQALAQPRGRSPVRGKDTVTVLREALINQIGDSKKVDEFFDNLARLIKAGSAKPIQIGNTVFLALRYNSRAEMLPEGVVEIHMFSAEPFSETAKRMMVLPNTLRELGYRGFTTYLEDKAMANLLLQMQKRNGIQGEIRQDIELINRKMKPVYRVEATL
jgi:hypothetical protein